MVRKSIKLILEGKEIKLKRSELDKEIATKLNHGKKVKNDLRKCYFNNKWPEVFVISKNNNTILLKVTYG